MGTKKTVYVGLSGGVDSAVSAALLQRDGYTVIGAFIHISLPGYPCPVAQDRQEAMRVAAHLKIPFREIDLSKEYQERVLKHSLAEFAKGRTPNPDTLCNREIKFGLFYEWAMREGAEHVATGHYAQLRQGNLHVSVDTEKDQSYFLWMVPQEHLAHVLFPVGDKTKGETRRLAHRFGLPNAARKDSQGLCFLGDMSLSDVVARELAPTPGDILDESGIVIGRHHGVALYTLGQRHGFDLLASQPHTKPQYVIAKNSEENTLTVSEQQVPMGVTQTIIDIEETNWIGDVQDGACETRFRYRQPLMHAELEKIKNGTARVRLHEPRYVPLGQSLVLYLPAQAGQGGRCLGGGIIASAALQ
jgi:tRNA-specific 2-thiouridylase